MNVAFVAPAVPHTTLTDQEIQAAYLAHHDLGPGYPQLPVAQHVTDLYLDDAIEAISLKFSPEWTPDKQAAVDTDLYLSVRRFLAIPDATTATLHCTFSGSVALDRALTASIEIVAPNRSSRVTVITTSPSIDIMKLFLAERKLLDVKFVESRAEEPWGLDFEGILAEIAAAASSPRKRGIIVLLTSPENPTGQCWSRLQLQRIGAECQRIGAILIVDQTFLTAGVHTRGQVSTVWDTLEAGADWLAIWDTGKTFGLNEDKLGFVICGSAAVDRAVRKSLGVLQFGVARRQKLFFSELMRRAHYYNHIDTLREICRCNMQTLQETTLQSGVQVVPPPAGSLAMLHLPSGKDDEQIRSHLLSVGVGVVAGNVFFHTAWKPRNLIRVALAREPAYFEQGLTRILAELGHLYG